MEATTSTAGETATTTPSTEVRSESTTTTTTTRRRRSSSSGLSESTTPMERSVVPDCSSSDASKSVLLDDENAHFSNSKLTLSILLSEGLVDPGEGVLSIDYLGQTFKGDLLASGKIKSQETNLIFNNPSAWAIYCKKIINPAKKSGCGWSSVKYKGRKMDHLKNAWQKLKAQRESMSSSSNNNGGCVIDSRVVKHGDLGPKIAAVDLESSSRNDLLVELESFKTEGRLQPFNVSFSSSAMLICQLHAHLCSNRIKGYLAGTWDLNTHNLAITHAFPCLIDPEEEENNEDLCSRIEFNIFKEIYGRHLSLVGSYRSRPASGPDRAYPSLAESESQLECQVRLLGPNDASYTPCVGLILRSFSSSLENNKSVFWTMPPIENVSHIEYGRPMLMDHKMVQDPCLSQEVLNEIDSIIGFVRKKSKYRKNLCELWSEHSSLHLVTRMGQCLHLYFPKDQQDERLWNYIRVGCLDVDIKEPLLKRPDEEEEEIDDDEDNALEKTEVTPLASLRPIATNEVISMLLKKQSPIRPADMNSEEHREALKASPFKEENTH